MDQTYIVNNQSMSLDEDLFEFFLYDDEQKSQREIECKQRLSQFRERSKQMLKRHDWQKFFPNPPVEVKKASVFERQLLQSNENELIVTEDESSFVSTIEYSFLMMDDQIKEQKSANKAMETPLISRKSSRVNSLFNIKKKKLSLDDSIDYDMNYQESAKKPKTDQSLTFIGDLASTSTPTRDRLLPITSTPKNISHNPAKYHPTQTIRNKRAKTNTKPHKHQKQKPTKPLNLSAQFTLLQENFIINHIQSSHKKIISVLSSSNQCPNNIITATSYNFINVDHSTPCQQRRNKIKKVKVEDVRRSMKRREHRARTVKTQSVTAKNTIGFALEDLLYTPRKLVSTGSFKTSNAVKLSDVVIASTPTVNLSQKVYFV